MDYIPNPTVQIDSYQESPEAASNKINNNEEVGDKKPDGLSVKMPRSRGSESPTVTTPMVRCLFSVNYKFGCVYCSTDIN